MHDTRYSGPSASIAALAIAALQLVFFLPTAAAGRAVDIGPYRVDGVALVYGTAWALAFAFALAASRRTRQAAGLLLTLLGLLSVAYSREPLLLYLSWEAATAGLWLALDHKPRLGRLEGALYLAGLPLLMAIMVGLVTSFSPPPGGVAAPWHIAIVLVMAIVVIMRVWLSLLIARTVQSSPLYKLYAMSAPILLVKALVAAPFDPFGMWALTLLGAAMLLAGAYLALFSNIPGQMQAVTWVMSGAVVAGLGLSPGSPLAAAGAVWLMLSWTFCELLPLREPRITNYELPGENRRFDGVALALALPGTWLIAQGALDLKYGLAAVLLLPCLMVALVRIAPPSGTTNYELPTRGLLWLMTVLALALAAYPQLPVDFAVQPVVQSMAGGVRALTSLTSDRGVGLMVKPAGTSASAGLPATGVMVALFLAFVTLYWLRRLARRFVGRSHQADAG